MLANRLLLLANVLYCTPVLYVLLHVLLLYFNVLYIVAYSTYFRCILLYSMYSAEGECTPMYLGVLCCVSGVHKALKWSIIDLAREHSNARISRQQGGHCRWQVAAGGDRMWPTCAMRWCWARFGGAHRESSPSLPPLQLPAWSRSRAVVKTLDAF